MKNVELKKGIYWVGSVDWDIRDFHGYSTEKGTTYNAYLVVDDKITLFDGVKKGHFLDLLHRVHNILDPKDIDYLVVNHVEPDHSGSVPEIVDHIKPEKVFTSPMGKKALEEYYSIDGWPLEVVKTGDKLSLGQREVQFLETRMLHWPDSMFSYLPDDKVLISNDAFGMHWATSERFADELDPSELMFHAAKYYANILLLYSDLVAKVLDQVGKMGLAIDVIAPDHGPIWRNDVSPIVGAYSRWCKQPPTAKGVVVFDTMWHSTELMAKAVADGLMDEGLSVKLMNLGVSHRSDVMTEVLDAGAMVFGSPTLNNGMLPRMADMLTYMKGLKPVNKVAAAFGSYGWSGEAVKDINAYLESMKGVEIVDNGFRTKYLPRHPELKTCRELGVKVAQALKAKL